MKICPVCKSRCFDDMQVCYGCMHRFDEQGGPLPSSAEAAAPIPSAPGDPVPAASGAPAAQSVPAPPPAPAMPDAPCAAAGPAQLDDASRVAAQQDASACAAAAPAVHEAAGRVFQIGEHQIPAIACQAEQGQAAIPSSQQPHAPVAQSAPSAQAPGFLSTEQGMLAISQASSSAQAVTIDAVAASGKEVKIVLVPL